MSDSLEAAVRKGNVGEVRKLAEESHEPWPSWKEGGGFMLLKTALECGHPQVVKLLLEKGALVNYQCNKVSGNLLHSAVLWKNQLEIVILFLDLNLDINEPNHVGLCPLHLAVLAENEKIVETLLQSKARPDAKDRMQNTPLHLASTKGLVKIAELLLKFNAPLNEKDIKGYQPLHLACREGKREVVSLLISYGADVNASCEEGPPLHLVFSDKIFPHYFKQVQRITIIKMLLFAGANVNAINYCGKTILHRAVEENLDDLVSTVVHFRADLNKPFDSPWGSNYTPLQFAAKRGFSEVAFRLIQHGAGINLETTSSGNPEPVGCTPLHLACLYGHVPIVAYFLRYTRVNLEARTQCGKTPLHTAISNHCSKIKVRNVVSFLLHKKADGSALDFAQNSIIHLAVESGDWMLVKIVFKKVSDSILDQLVNHTNSLGYTPLHLAASTGDLNTIQVLLNHGVPSFIPSSKDGCTPLHIACKYLIDSRIKLFVKKNADVNALTSQKQTPAHIILSSNFRMWHYKPKKFAFWYKNHCMIALSLFLEHHTDVNSIDNYGDTILNLGVKLGSLKVVQKILRYKPNINDPNNIAALRTAVIMETRTSVEENKSIIDELVGYGLTLTIHDAQNKKLLILAIQKGCTSVVETLLHQGADFESLENGFNLLHIACMYKQGEIIQLLVDRGANVNKLSLLGQTPAHLIFSHPGLFWYRNLTNIVASFKILMNKGADINNVDSNGNSILNSGVLLGDLRIVELILDFKPDLSNTHNKTALSTALLSQTSFSHEENCAIIDKLFQYGLVFDGTEIERCKNRLLYCALQKGNISVSKHLLNYGCVLQRYQKVMLLHEAVRMGRNSIMKLLIESGVDVNAKNSYGRTPIYHVTKMLGSMKLESEHSSQLFNMAEELLCKGADLAKDSKLLVSAVRNKKYDLVELSLKANANVNFVTKSGCTALHAATFANDDYLVSKLLERGAKINMMNSKLHSPLLIALFNKVEPIVHHLLDLGADINTKDKNGFTPLHCAAKWGNCEIIGRLLKLGAEINSQTSQHHKLMTPLLLSAELGHGDAIKVLLNGGADAKAVSSKYMSALHFVIQPSFATDENIIRTLLEHGADIDAANFKSQTPLLMAISQNIESLTLELLENGAHVNAQDDRSYTPLHYAAEWGHIGFIKWLIQFGAEIDAQTSKNTGSMTPLHLAAISRQSKAVIVLLDHGADTNAVCVDGNTALHMVIQPDFKDGKFLVKALLEFGANINVMNTSFLTPLHLALSKNIDSISSLLICSGASVNIMNKYQWTPLHEAAQHDNAYIVEKLIQSGANVNALTHNNETPLLCAVQAGYQAIVPLIEGGAIVNTKDINGNTPLHFAVMWYDVLNTEKLLSFGADPRLRNNDLKTPLIDCIDQDGTCQVSHIHVRVLLENGGNTDDTCCYMINDYFNIIRFQKWDFPELGEVLHLHFLDMEARDLWPAPRGLCSCQSRIHNTLIPGNKEEEITKIKSKNIVQGFNFFDILSLPKKKLATLAWNSAIFNCLSTIDFLTDFPIFGKLLKYRWNCAVERKNLLSAAVRPFNFVVLESVVSHINANPCNNIFEGLTKCGYSWVLEHSKINSLVNENSNQENFVASLRCLQSLLPCEIVEVIVDHLSDYDLQSLIKCLPTTKSSFEPDC